MFQILTDIGYTDTLTQNLINGVSGTHAQPIDPIVH